MGKKPAGQGKKEERDRTVLIKLSESEYQSLRAFCYQHELKFAPFIRKVLAERLEREARKP